MTGSATDTAAIVASTLNQAQTAIAATDVIAARTVLDTLLALDWSDADRWTAASIRDALQAALAVHELVTEDDRALERLFARALALYQATNASFSDTIVACYNLQALYAQRGDLSRRNETASRAVALASRYTGPLTDAALSALLSLIDAFFAAHQFDAVAHLYHPVGAWARAAPDMTQSTRVALLARSGNARAAIGQYEASLADFSAAAQYLDGVDAAGDSWRVDVLTGQAAAAARCGQTGLAGRAYDAALQALSNDTQVRDDLRETLCFNAAVFWLDSAQLQRAGDAERLLTQSQALCAARVSVNSLEYALGLIELARAVHARQHDVQATEYLRQAARIVDATRRQTAEPRMLTLLAGASRALALSMFDAQRFEPAGDAWFLAVRSQWHAGLASGNPP